MILAFAFVAVFAETVFSAPRNLLGAQIDLLPGLMVFAALNNCASNSARVTNAAPTRLADATSGTVSSTAADATTICSLRVTPEPSCGKSAMPCPRRKSNFSVVRPSYAAAGIGMHLWQIDHALTLKCINALAVEATLVQELSAAQGV